MEISVSLDPAVNKNLEEYVNYMNKMLLGIGEKRFSFHVDVMDGNFVERAAVNMTEYEFITNSASVPMDVHLMIDNPQDGIEKYLQSPHFHLGKGVRSFTFHVEALSESEAEALILKIQKAGFKGGVAIDLDTHIEAKETHALIAKSDVVLIMSVKAGKSGQVFNTDSIKKVRQIKKINPAARVILDGGINKDNIAIIKKAGVDTAVVGNYIYSAKDRKVAVLSLINQVS